MHPEVKKDKPGKCTKCGMNLEKKETKKKPTKTLKEKRKDKREEK